MVTFSWILLLTFFSMVLTLRLINFSGFPPVRASGLVTLVVVGAMTLSLPQNLSSAYGGAVLGGSFVGMTEFTRLRYKGLVGASLLFACCYYFLLPYNKGFGGILGLFAFLSCLVVYKISALLRY